MACHVGHDGKQQFQGNAGICGLSCGMSLDRAIQILGQGIVRPKPWPSDDLSGYVDLEENKAYQRFAPIPSRYVVEDMLPMFSTNIWTRR